MPPRIAVGFVGWSLRCGGVVWCRGICLGAMCTLCYAVCGIVAWTPPEGGLFPQ